MSRRGRKVTGEAKKSYLKRWLLSPVMFVLLLGFAYIACASAYNFYGRYQDVAVKAETERAELRELQLKQAELKAQKEHLATPFGQEELVRSRASVAKAGETVIQIVDDLPDDEYQQVWVEPSWWESLWLRITGQI